MVGKVFGSKEDGPVSGRPFAKRRPRCGVGIFPLMFMVLSLGPCCGVPFTRTVAKASHSVSLMGLTSLRGGGDGSTAVVKDSTGATPKKGQRETLYEAYNMLHTLAQVC